ncbi:thymidine kinase 2, mitochondrial-like [Liolophura sinensis]|uniref:thymidine kinase 2, mitochondrial-like n=1 Tax=Liolophura sinensis TaxID=3198878 RepID=UPI0031596753
MLGEVLCSGNSENKENECVCENGGLPQSKHVHQKRKPLKIAVEGNIGCGKSTFLQYFSKCPWAKVFPEPISMWKDVHGHNTLKMMYEDPRRWSLAFQSYVQLTMQNIHCAQLSKKVRMKFMERSIFSARYCFVENLHFSNLMHGVDSAILDEWFHWILKNVDVNLDLIVYLKASPQTCHNRIQRRQRGEESAVSLKYLEVLHDLHEDWLIRENRFKLPAPVLVLDAECDVDTLVKTFKSQEKMLFGGNISI